MLTFTCDVKYKPFLDLKCSSAFILVTLSSTSKSFLNKQICVSTCDRVSNTVCPVGGVGVSADAAVS